MAKPTVKPTSTSDQTTKPGECNLLPVLVERLRSALELSCSSQSSEDPQPLEDSGIDSEEDLRMWASGLCHSIEQSSNNNQSPKSLDLKFLEDLLLSDIQTALSRLQDTLTRVDVNTLTKYNSTLDSTNKLHLLRLISNLLSKLKVPEELDDNKETSTNKTAQSNPRRRSRANRHTIGVSAEEIAHARRLLDEKNLGTTIADSTVDIKPIEPLGQDIKPVEIDNFIKPAVHQQVIQQQPQTELKTFDQVRDKHVKDAINQQQTYYNKNKEFHNDGYYHPPPPLEDNPGALNRVEIPYKEENYTADQEYGQQQSLPSFHQQPITSKYNKFNAKKSKIKRANTIDIPNYLKLQAENFGQNQANALRRPIDIGDKSLNTNANIIPAFKPKTDNDRKFLALINKNNDAAPSNSNLPFKSFNYRQPANIDKNWNSRFSNIKTTFDKPTTNFVGAEESVKPQSDSSRRSQSGANSDGGESDGVVVGSLRLPYAAPPKQKQSGFTHAPTSPFQKIEKPSKTNENASIFKSGYLPKGGNSLQAKVKIFNQENSTPPSIVAQNKNKFNKINDVTQYGNGELKPVKFNQHGSFTYNPAYKPNDSNKNESKQDNTIRSYLPGNRNVISSKLIVNANANDEVSPRTKTQYPYLGYSANTTNIKPDEMTSNDEQNAYTQYQNSNSYPDKMYGFIQPKKTEVPARTSSHSFMLQKIANENNYETKPRVNRYVNEALKIKDNKESVRVPQPLTSHYIKPAPPMDKYSGSNVPLQNHSTQNKHNVVPLQNFVPNNDQNKRTVQEYNATKIDKNEYKPPQIYSNNVPHDVKVNVANNLTQNYPASYDTGANRYQIQTDEASQYIPHQANPVYVKKTLPEPNYATSSFPKSYDASNDRERYSNQPISDPINQLRNLTIKENSVKDIVKLPVSQPRVENYNASYDGSSDRFSGQVNPGIVKVQIPNPVTYKQDSNYAPYQSYQSKNDVAPSNERSKNYQETNYYNTNPSSSLQNERLQGYNGPYDEILNVQNQTAQYNIKESVPAPLPLEESNSDKEMQLYTQDLEQPILTDDLYHQKDLLLEDENIQNQDISSEGIVTRYQCAIATVATTPESSEPDLAEINFPNPKLYNMNISAYPSTTNEKPQVQNASYDSYGHNKPLAKTFEPEKELRDESSDAFDEIQRHNILQQQIIQKLQNDGNSNKEVRRRSLEKFKFEGRVPADTDRRSSYYEKFKSEDRSPTSPSFSFPYNNKVNSVPKQTEEPVIECNNTLEKISIFEEKSQPIQSNQRQRFRPLSIPKFNNKPKDFPAPKINVVTPSKVVKPKFEDNNSTVINSSTNMCDSSDEYLMSCANRQSRSIVLSKSESWHQLALSRGGNLQVPQSSGANPLLKPPKPKSPASLRLPKPYEASSTNDNMKRMEEKIQRYFNSPTNVPSSESTSNSKRDSKSKRHFSSKKNQTTTTGLSRSRTMPHLYDDKLIDDNTDVEKAFDSLFMEATRADNRY